MKGKAGGKKKKTRPQQSLERFFLNFGTDVLGPWLAETRSSGKPCLSHNQRAETHSTGKEQKKLFLTPIKYELLAGRFSYLI